MTLTHHSTVLLVENVALQLEYYRDKLGFEASAWEINASHYAWGERDSCHLHFACFGGGHRG